MKLTRILMVLGVLLLAVGFVGAPMVLVAEGEGAWVSEDDWCTISASASGLDIGLSTYDSHTVVTPSGNWKLICHFIIPEEYIPENTLHNSGFPCGILGPGTSKSTDDSQSVAATDGTALLKCTFKN